MREWGRNSRTESRGRRERVLLVENGKAGGGRLPLAKANDRDIRRKRGVAEMKVRDKEKDSGETGKPGR